MENQITRIDRAETLEALNRSEIDIQIATAKKYPRDIQQSINKIRAIALQDEDTAQECFYSLRRNGRDGNANVVEGPSVRFAEIVAASWGNLRVASQVVANDGKFITARGVCLDLESNVAVSSEVQRRITDKYGKTFSEDMQVVTGNAAAAIAFRNAVFKVVPKAVTSSVLTAVRQAAIGKATDIESATQKMFAYFAKIGVTEPMVLSYLGVKARSEITAEMIVELRGASTAIKEGTSTAKEMFVDPYNASCASAKATGEAKTRKEAVAAAMSKQDKGTEGGGDMSAGLEFDM